MPTTLPTAGMVEPTGACHARSTWDNFYADARSLGIMKRIDVVAQATAQLMDTADGVDRLHSQGAWP